MKIVVRLPLVVTVSALAGVAGDARRDRCVTSRSEKFKSSKEAVKQFGRI